MPTAAAVAAAAVTAKITAMDAIVPVSMHYQQHTQRGRSRDGFFEGANTHFLKLS